MHMCLRTDPVLSVVLPVRDAEPFIADALNSLRNNADPRFEFIVIDDGSADGTSEVIADHAELLPQMRVIGHRQRGRSGRRPQRRDRRGPGALRDVPGR